MKFINENYVLPTPINKEITYMLFNYNNIDKIIEKRKLDLIDTIDNTKEEYLRGMKNSSKTLEDVVIGFDYDKNINRLRKWKSTINEYIRNLKNDNNLIYYKVFSLKYLKGIKDNDLMEYLSLTKTDLKKIDILLKYQVYLFALKNGLFKR